MSTELELLYKDLEKNGERRKELRAKLSRRDIGMGERAITSNLLEQVYEDERDIMRLIKEQEDGIKHDELIAEAQRLLAERVKLEMELKDKSGQEKEAAEKKVVELSAAMNKAIAEADALGHAYEEGTDDCCCGENGYSYYDNGHDHLAGANGYNSY